MKVMLHVERLASEGSAYHLLLHLGEMFQGRTRASTVRAAARWKDRYRPRCRRCYANAAEFCLAHPDAQYREGYWWCGGGEPVHHAWVVVDGHLIDFTAEGCDHKARRRGVILLPPNENEYLGISVPTDYVRRLAEKNFRWRPASASYLTDLATAVEGGGPPSKAEPPLGLAPKKNQCGCEKEMLPASLPD